MSSADRDARRPTKGRGLPWFFGVAVVSGAAFLVLLVWSAVSAFGGGVRVRDVGWTASATDAGWRVASVRPQGPAAGLLARDDVVVAVDGDRRAGRIGPAWWLRDLPAGGRYDLLVARGGTETSVTLDVLARPDPGFTAWAATYFLVSLGCLAVAVMLALFKPEERMVQFAAAGLFFTAAFMLYNGVRPGTGLGAGRLTHLLVLAFPLYFVFGYLFFERFPRPVERTGRWRAISAGVVYGGAAIWVAHNIPTVLYAVPASVAAGIVDPAFPLVRALELGRLVPDLLFVVGVVWATLAVLWRNYRRLPAGADRRRIVLLIGGQLVSLVPALLSALASAVINVTGASAGVASAVDVSRKVSNGLALAVPISFGYAIVKHRVLGFAPAVRLGIQYVLAQNALRAAVLVPVGWMAFTAIRHPDWTIGQILFGGAGKVNVAIAVLAALGLQYRTRLATAIDRRFFRSAYDQEAILHRLVDSVKAADSVEDVAGMASREIVAALHVARVFVFYHNRRAGEFVVSYSTEARPAQSPIAEDSPLIGELERGGGAARDVEELTARAASHEAAWLADQGIELVLPLMGIDRNVVGLLMVGGKKSEEPFTAQDRALLRLVAGQIGSVYEVLALRETIGRQQEIQTEVLASVDERRINLVKECPACGRCYDRADTVCADDGQALALSLPVERTLDGKYRLERLIGRGGMGAVYEARDLRLDRRVAVKVIKGSSVHGTAARRRFAREAQACARLDHPNIVRVHDYAASDGQAAYLVMEHVEGVSWARELRRAGVMPPAQAADLLDQVFDGMEAAHAAGVLHRDLKPDNLLIRRGPAGGAPRVTILDFGLAKVRESSFEDPKSQTVAGLTMGTFGYMSPEQLAAETVDERTDVYALGVVALETLTGPLPPFGPNFHPIIEAEVDARLLKPARTPAHRALADAIARALAPSRTQRFVSIAEMRAALIPALRQCSDMPAPSAVAPSAAAPTAALDPTRPAEERDTRLDPG